LLRRQQSNAAREQSAEGGSAGGDEQQRSGNAFPWHVVGDYLCEIKRKMIQRERILLLREQRGW
jgi:hypothetical protein